jgi:endonuclease/exonuclease/phosphatase family metal-dependent hydrolase
MNLRLLSFNLHHHEDSKDVNAFDEQLDIIAQQNPHLMFLTEVEQYTGYNGNRDSIAAIKAGLEARMGATNMITVADNGSASSSPSTKGQHVTVFAKSPLAFSSVSRQKFYGGREGQKRSLLLFSVTFNGKALNFVTFHGQHGQATPGNFHTPNEGIRAAGWVDLNYSITNTFTNTSVPRFIIGDLNSQPGQPSMEFAFGTYYDLWAEAPVKSQPARCVDGETYIAGNPPTTITDYDRRLDYILYGKRTWALPGVKALECRVIDTTRPDGSQASDHFPLLGVFDIG